MERWTKVPNRIWSKSILRLQPLPFQEKRHATLQNQALFHSPLAPIEKMVVIVPRNSSLIAPSQNRRRVNSRKSEAGSALIEFTFVVPVLVMMALGVFSFSYAIRQGMAVQSAAHAGAEYGSSEGYFYNTTAMQSTAVGSASEIPGLAATASNFCSCTAGGTLVSCSSFCNTYDLPMQYAQVLTSATPSILFRYTGFPISFNLSGKSIRRIR